MVECVFGVQQGSVTRQGQATCSESLERDKEKREISVLGDDKRCVRREYGRAVCNLLVYGSVEIMPPPCAKGGCNECLFNIGLKFFCRVCRNGRLKRCRDNHSDHRIT